MSSCSIESLNVKDGADAWSIIVQGQDFTNRIRPAVAALSDSTFAVYGGTLINLFSDGFLVDLKK